MITLSRLEALFDDPSVKAALEATEQSFPGRAPSSAEGAHLVVGHVVGRGRSPPAHLSRVHTSLIKLPPEDRLRLGVLVSSSKGPHLLTYRQVEYTARLVCSTLGKDKPDGAGSALLEALQGALIESSVPAECK